MPVPFSLLVEVECVFGVAELEGDVAEVDVADAEVALGLCVFGVGVGERLIDLQAFLVEVEFVLGIAQLKGHVAELMEPDNSR